MDIVKVLIEHGANVNIKDGFGWVPLHSAASMGNFLYCCFQTKNKIKFYNNPGHADVVELLIKEHSNVNARNDIGWTPIHLAAEKGFFFYLLHTFFQMKSMR